MSKEQSSKTEEIPLGCTNLITCALFSTTYLLNLVELEIAPFKPPTSKTLP